VKLQETRRSDIVIQIRSASPGTYDYTCICKYINAVVNSVMYLM